MKIEVTQADIELRKAILKCIVDTLDRPCTDGDMIDDRTDNLDRIIAAHRILATRTDATPVAVEMVAELQLSAFLAGRGSIRTKANGNTHESSPGPTMDDYRRMARFALAEGQVDATPVASMQDFQAETDQWMDVCFGSTIKADTLERDDRFIEECLELVQTNPAFTADRAHALVDYVFGRPVGEPFQETGGVMVTLAARSNAAGISIKDAAETELARIWTKVEAIRAKQATKPVGSALPIAATHPPVTDVAALVEAVKRIQRLADRCSNLPDTDGLRRAYRDIDVMAQAALAPFTKG